MSDRSDYTEEQWLLLVEAPRCAAMGVVVSDFGLVQFAKEALEMVRYTQDAEARYADQPFIQSILVEMTSTERTTGWHVPWRCLGDQMPKAERRPKRIAARMLAKINEAVRVLDEHAEPEEAAAFKRFIYDYADRVAHASGDGWLGLGELVSDKEAVFLDQLREVLSL